MKTLSKTILLVAICQVALSHCPDYEEMQEECPVVLEKWENCETGRCDEDWDAMEEVENN